MHELFQRPLDTQVFFSQVTEPHYGTVSPSELTLPGRLSILARSVQPAKHVRKPQRGSGRRACAWRGRAAGPQVSGVRNSFGADHHPGLLAHRATPRSR